MFNFDYNPYIKFSNIDDNIYKLILDNGYEVRYKVDNFVIKPYELVENIYYIDSGLVKSAASDLEGKEQVFALLGKGSCIGAGHTFLNLTSEEAYTKTIQQTKMYKISTEKFISIFDSSRDFRNYILKNITSFTRILMKSMCNKTFLPHSKNLYNFLVYSASIYSIHDEFWYKLDYNFTQPQLADILGTSLSSINRAIHTLCDEGKIRIINKKIEVNIPVEIYKQFFEQNYESQI